MFNNFKTYITTGALALATISSSYALTNVDTVKQDNANDIVAGAVNNTFDIIKEYSGKVSSTNPELKAQVIKYVLPYFNTKYIAASILGSYFRGASSDSVEKFTKAVEDYMAAAYIEGLSFYKSQKVEIKDAKDTNPKFSEANVIVYDKKPITVLFKLLKRNDGTYRIVDFTAEGISIVDTKKLEWQPILAKDGVDGLTKYIQENSKDILKQYKNIVK